MVPAAGCVRRLQEEIDQGTLNSIEIKSHTYKFHGAYGSPKEDEKAIDVDDIKVTPDGRTATLEVGELKERYLHAVDMSGVRSKAGEPCWGTRPGTTSWRVRSSAL